MNNSNSNPINVFTVLHSFIFRFSVILSICCLTLSFADMLFMKAKISGEKFLYLALMSFLIAIAMAITDLLKAKKINSVITYTVNFLLCYLSFGVVFYLMRNDISDKSFNTPFVSFIMLTIVFVVVYAVIAAIRTVAGSIKRKILNRNKAYEKLYTENN